MKNPKLNSGISLGLEDEIRKAMEKAGELFIRTDEFEATESELSRAGRPVVTKILELLERSADGPVNSDAARSVRSKIKELVGLIQEKSPMMTKNRNLFANALEELAENIVV